MYSVLDNLKSVTIILRQIILAKFTDLKLV